MKMIGSIKKKESDSAPSIFDLISDTPMPNKSRIVSYMRRGEVIAVAAGFATDVITGERINGDFLAYSDGTYLWQSDTIYYVEKYNMELPEEFINHIIYNK